MRDSTQDCTVARTPSATQSLRIAIVRVGGLPARMVHEWIRAPQALEYVSAGSIDAATMRICERAHSGLIVAKADVIHWQGQEERGRLIPKDFWWAEGHEALEQDWQAGDFSTWIDKKIEVKAFGVSFDFLTLSELVPADKQAQALRAVSVLSSEDWLSAHGLIRMMYDKHGPNKASAALHGSLPPWPNFRSGNEGDW